jgi:hypothetical protein
VNEEQNQYKATEPSDGEEGPLEGAFLMAQSEADLSKKLVDEVGIDKRQAEEAIRLVQQSYSGPIPFAAELMRYNEVSHDLGTDIARDYLKGREHDRKCEEASIELAKQESGRKDNWLDYARRGQGFGMLSQVLFVASAIAAMLLGHLYLAGIFIGPPALGVVTQFIKGIRPDETNSKELAAKESE